MIDPASQHYPRALHLPPPGRPRWVGPPDATTPLLYLSWGRRFYGQSPIPVSRHPGWVYVLVQRGQPQLRLTDQRVTLAPGQMLIIHPDCPSGWCDEPQSEAALLTWTWRNPSGAAECQPARRSYQRWMLDPSRRREVARLHAATRREIERPDQFTPFAVAQLQTQLDVLLARSRTARPASAQATLRLEWATRWMAENLTARQPVRSLCEYLQVSPATVVRLFRRHLQQSPQEYHQHLRLTCAEGRLRGSRLAIKEIAYELGYRHPHDFTRAFTRWAKRPPSACRLRSPSSP